MKSSKSVLNASGVAPIDTSNQLMMIRENLHPPFVEEKKQNRMDLNVKRNRRFYAQQIPEVKKAIREILKSSDSNKELVLNTYQIPYHISGM